MTPACLSRAAGLITLDQRLKRGRDNNNESNQQSLEDHETSIAVAAEAWLQGKRFSDPPPAVVPLAWEELSAQRVSFAFWTVQPVEAADPAPPVLSIRIKIKDGESLTCRDKQSMVFKVLITIDFTNEAACLWPIN